MCIHVCIYVIFKLGFERYGGNCPSWEGELSGEIVQGGIVRGELSGENVSYPAASQCASVKKSTQTAALISMLAYSEIARDTKWRGIVSNTDVKQVDPKNKKVKTRFLF